MILNSHFLYDPRSHFGSGNLRKYEDIQDFAGLLSENDSAVMVSWFAFLRLSVPG
jgi:hypothetical protein